LWIPLHVYSTLPANLGLVDEWTSHLSPMGTNGNSQYGRSAAGVQVRNRILAAIPESEFRVLEPHFRPVDLPLGMYLQSAGEPATSLFFLNHGLASLMVETSNGKSVEVGVSGPEDMVGWILPEGMSTLHSVIVQIPGHGFQANARDVNQLLPSVPHFRDALFKRVAIRSVLMAQNAACNRLHAVRQRLARWLLVTQDRINTNLIATTHDFLSKMVGADRATVTLAANSLQRAEAIRNGRGSLTIVDRQKLEREACECYAAFSRFNSDLGLPDLGNVAHPTSVA
jgi:CRP-like cAMP-binding protein